MNLADLRADARFLTNTDSSTYTDVDLDRNINRHYDYVVSLIWYSVGDWTFDDKNQSDPAIATINLVDKQQNYSIPTTARKIERMEIKDDKGRWHLLKPIDKSMIKVALNEYKKSPGLPMEYNLFGNYIYLYPPPDANKVTLTNGLKIYISRNIIPLTASGDSPGFDSEFHRILSLGAAQDFCIAHELASKEIDLRRMKEDLIEKLKIHYSLRHRNLKPKMIPRKEYYG